MAFKVHSINNYSYSYTLTGNDYAAKLQLWKAGATPTAANIEVAQIRFMYEGAAIPANVINADLEHADLYRPIKDLAGIIDLLRHEKPISFTLNPPFAFVGTSIEPTGEEE